MGIFMKEGNPALGKTYRVVFLEEDQEKKITSELENADGLHYGNNGEYINSILWKRNRPTGGIKEEYSICK